MKVPIEVSGILDTAVSLISVSPRVYDQHVKPCAGSLGCKGSVRPCNPP